MSNVSPTKADWAYAAGFFDGEGHIRIQTHSRRCRTMMLQITLTQATPDPLDWFKDTFGGTTKARRVPYKGDTRAIYNWQASSSVAEAFLRGISEFSKNKSGEISLALKFRETFRPQHVIGGHKRMSDDELSVRRNMAESLKAMRIEKRRIADEAVPDKEKCVAY